MITRYEKEEISKIWTDQNRFNIFLDVEVSLLKALETAGVIPQKISNKVKSAKIDPKRIREIEKETRHDIIAFCTSITEQFDTDVSKYFHFGVTSSDIIDTSLSLQIKQSLDYIIPAFKKLLNSLSNQARKYENQICIGRSHGIWAEPMSFGQKILGHYCEFNRRYEDLKNFYDKELTGQFSGAVGNYTILSPAVEKEAINSLGLKVEDVSTQIIPRDRIAKLISIFSLFGCALERFCIEIRHLQHSDIGEVFEGFAKGQKGSSTMPHKKNPISTENLTGMARMLRSHYSLAMDNTLLWHERDISHSSAERMYLPDALGLMLYSIERLNSTVENLVVNKERMESKVNQQFHYLSSFVLHRLIERTNNTREDLYKYVQKASFEATDKASFFSIIKDQLTSENHNIIEEIQDLDVTTIYSQHTNSVFERCVNEEIF